MASDFVKIETMMDFDLSPDLCQQDNEGVDHFDNLDSVGWENYENALEPSDRTDFT